MRQALLTLMAEVAAKDELLERQQRDVAFKQAQVDKLTHELAVLKRLKFAATSEKFCAGLSAQQKSLIEETLDADIAEAAAEIDRANVDKKSKDKRDKQSPSARCYRRICRAATCTTSPQARHAPAAAR